MKGWHAKGYAQMMNELVPDEDIGQKTAQEEDISVTHHCPDCGGPLGFTLEFDDQGYPIWNCKACDKRFPENELPEEKTAANLDPSREFLMGQCGACANGFEWGDGAHVYCPILDAPKHYMESCNENLVGMPKPQRPENEACLKKIRTAAAGLRDAMVEHARQMFPEADDSDIEAALYWFASDNHEGQWSDLYSILSTSPYTPGRLMTSVEDEGELAEMIYEAFENMGQQFTQAAKKTAQDSEHMYAATCPECGGRAGYTGPGDWYKCEQCGTVFDPKLDARIFPETVQDIEDSRAFKGAGMIPISQIERGVYDVALANGRVQGEQDVMNAWATAAEVAAYFENTSEDEIMDAVSRDSTLKLEGDKISFADNPLSFTDEKGKTRPRASMDTWGKFSKRAYKLQEHGDGTYDVLDEQGNVVMSQESYQVASNFIEGSPRGEYSETDEVRDAYEKRKQADQEADPIEKARMLGQQAFENGKQAVPAWDAELMELIGGSGSLYSGDTSSLLDAWMQGWHGANVAAPVPGWTDDENQALRDAR